MGFQDGAKPNEMLKETLQSVNNLAFKKNRCKYFIYSLLLRGRT